MVQFVKFDSGIGIVKGNNINPVPIGEGNAVISLQILPSEIDKILYFQGNTQGNLRFKATLGSLQAIHFKIYFLSTEISNTEWFVQTVSSFSGAVETIEPVDRKVTTTGNFDYYFTIPAASGLRIVFWGEGTANTGSRVELVHCAFRTN